MNTELPLHYRIREIHDEDGVSLQVQKWRAIKETRQGYWIQDEHAPHWYDPARLKKYKLVRWVSKTSVRRYAYPVFADALHSFYIRKMRQIMHLELALHIAQQTVKDFDDYKNMGPQELAGLNLGKTEDHDRYNWDY